MDEVKKILSNPILRTGLKMAAPEVALGIDLAMLLFGSLGARKPSIAALLRVIDQRLAVILKELAETESRLRRSELEIRAHELLGLLNEWDKIN